MNRERRETTAGCGSTSRVKPKTNRLAGAILLGSTVFLCAGEAYLEEPLAVEAPAAKASGGFCDAYRNIGKLYSNSDNPFIQDFSLIGRFHYTYGRLRGSDAFGNNFDYDTTEVRRFRLGAKAKVLNYFTVKGQAEIFNDQQPRGGDEREFEFQHTWDLYVAFDAQKAFGIEGLDTLQVGYGKRETHTSYEWDTSSNKLKTVERSAISNKVWPSTTEFDNPTGGWVKLGQGNWETELGVFSTTQHDYLAPWEDGQMYWGNLHYDFSEVTGADVSELFVTGYYQNAEITDERLAGGVEWSSSIAMTYGRGPWQFTMEGIYGKNGDQTNADREGNFWGFVFLPSIWLVEDKLEAVARYQYQGSENDQGIRLNSRYARRADTTDAGADLLGGRGNEHHSYYLGLKYHLCENNIHALLGVEYDDINRGSLDIYDGWTTFVGFRTYF